MHMLHLLRHAKSSWKEDVDDHERRLNKRGREAARLIGRQLPAAIQNVDLVLCSSAARTRETLEFVVAGYAQRPRCMIEDGLYLAGCDKLLERVGQIDESIAAVLLIGHNPGLHELAVALADPGSPWSPMLAHGKFPTLARASFEIGTRWSAIGECRHRLVDYVIPAALSDWG
jgi:phosphohistidine phosphatase